MNDYEQYLARKKREHGDKFDDSDLAAQFIPFYESGARIKVAHGDYVRYGRVGVTTGWKPAFLLMPRIDSSGSSDVLSDQDVIVAVQRNGHYVPVAVAVN